MKILLLLPILAFLGVSCSSSSPSKRIEKNPEIYSSLSDRHKGLVENGQIEKGMLPQAVFLAWGQPDSRAEGQNKGTDYERWTYTSLTPIYSRSAFGGFGYGHGGFRGHGFGRGGFRRGGRGFGGGGFFSSGGFGTHVSYIPSRIAWVKFEGERVESWQRGRTR